LCSHVIARDPHQFGSQVIARLLPWCEQNQVGLVREFATAMATAAPRPWVKLLRSTIHTPGAGLIRTFPGHSGHVTAVAITPDARVAVSACQDGTLKVWNLESGTEVRSLLGHSGSVAAVVVTSDGRRAVSASGDKTIRVWDLQTGTTIHT